MFSGLLNTTISIESRTNTGTDFRPVYTWAEFASLSALRYKLSERETPKNEGMVVLADYKFFCDYKSGITTDMRIKHNDIYYNIYSVDNVNDMNRHLEIMAKQESTGVTNES